MFNKSLWRGRDIHRPESVCSPLPRDSGRWFAWPRPRGAP